MADLPLPYKSPKPPRQMSRYIEWDENGLPCPRYGKPFNPLTIQQIAQSEAALEYVPDPNDEEEQQYKGLTQVEVIYKKAFRELSSSKRIDVELFNAVMDRTMGKPKQFVESVQTNLTYEDWLTHQSPPTPQELGIEVDAGTDEFYRDDEVEVVEVEDEPEW